MKRVLALVLAVVMLAALLPTSIVTHAETVTKEPFYLLSFSRDFATGTYEHIYWKPYTWINSSKFDANSESINIGVYFYEGSASNVEKAAAKLYEEFKDRPVGTRRLGLSAMKTVFEKCVKDAVDMEDGVRLVKDWVNRFLDAYQALGGELDGIGVDLEYNYAYYFYVQSHHYNNSDESKRNRNIYNDIVNNKAYKERIRPKLVELEKQGLWHFYENPDPAKYPERSEIWTMYRYDNKGGDATCRSTWNRVIQELLVEYINEAVYEPMIAHYPDAVLGDYGVVDSFGWNKTMGTTGGDTGYSMKAGNTSDESFYNSKFSPYFFAETSGSATRKLYYKPDGHNDAVFNPETPYGRALYDVNTQKRVLASTWEATPENKSDDHVTAHVSFFNYGARTGFANTAYYSEVIYHLSMASTTPLQGYILERDVKNAGKDYDDPNISDYAFSLKICDELMAELTRVAGASDRKPIVTPISWNGDYILSGMYAGGRNIWRITPNTDAVSVEDFKVKDFAPTFSANGLTITFPQGRIIADSEITHVGSCGYWVETPANVTPVVTSTADRYANNPSFEETFDRYALGAFAGSATSQTGLLESAHPDTYWTATGNAEIVENGGNKAISLTGTTTLLNDKVPANITAGDIYAMRQVWEVTVTLPASDAYDTVTLLMLDDDDSATTDAMKGFLLRDGQVRCFTEADGSDYQVIDGLDLSDGGTYTFRRILDFSGDERYFCDYYVLDNTGGMLGCIEGVELSSTKITLPVAKITMETTEATEAVVIDDYKLYPFVQNADLEIYDANTGRKITNTDTIRTDRTAYRMSWMNATCQHMVAQIYDAMSGAILQTVEMAPGMDGVVTGIVEANANAPVQIEMGVQDGTAPSQPNYDIGDFSWTAISESLGLATGVKPVKVVYGDATGDGVIDGMDVIRLKKYLANYDYNTHSSPVEIAVGADVTGDGIIDGVDVIRLKKYLANYDYNTGESAIPLGPQ